MNVFIQGGPNDGQTIQANIPDALRAHLEDAGRNKSIPVLSFLEAGSGTYNVKQVGDQDLVAVFVPNNQPAKDRDPGMDVLEHIIMGALGLGRNLTREQRDRALEVERIAKDWFGTGYIMTGKQNPELGVIPEPDPRTEEEFTPEEEHEQTQQSTQEKPQETEPSQ